MLRVQLKTWNINLRLSRSSIYLLTRKSTSWPYLEKILIESRSTFFECTELNQSDVPVTISLLVKIKATCANTCTCVILFSIISCLSHIEIQMSYQLVFLRLHRIPKTCGSERQYFQILMIMGQCYAIHIPGKVFFRKLHH